MTADIAVPSEEVEEILEVARDLGVDPEHLIKAEGEMMEASLRLFYRIMLDQEGVTADEDATSEQLSDRLRQRLREKETD